MVNSVFSPAAQDYNSLIVGDGSTTPYGPLQAPQQTQNQQQPAGSGQSFPSLNSLQPSNLSNPTSLLNKTGSAIGLGPGTISYSGVGPGMFPWSQPGMIANPALAGSAGVAPTAGSLGTTATLGQVAGSAAIGSWLGGKISGNTQGSVLGAIGGGVGSALAGTASGAAIGAALGIGAQALNFVLPGVGILVGGLAGKLFGKKKPPDRTMAGAVNLASGEINPWYAQTQSSTGKKFSSQNAQFRDQLQGSVSSLSRFLLDNGATPKTHQTDLVLVTGERDGYRYFFRNPEKLDDTTQLFNSGKDYKKYSNDLSQAIISNYNIPEPLQQKLGQMKFDDIARFGQAPASSISQGGVYNKPTVNVGKSDNSFQTFVNSYAKSRKPA